MGTSNRYSSEVRERAVRMVFEHESEHESQWATIKSIAAKIGELAGGLAQVGAPGGTGSRRAARPEHDGA